jgi:hypothetical protein
MEGVCMQSGGVGAKFGVSGTVTTDTRNSNSKVVSRAAAGPSSGSRRTSPPDIHSVRSILGSAEANDDARRQRLRAENPGKSDSQISLSLYGKLDQKFSSMSSGANLQPSQMSDLKTAAHDFVDQIPGVETLKRAIIDSKQFEKSSKENRQSSVSKFFKRAASFIAGKHNQ